MLQLGIWDDEGTVEEPHAMINFVLFANATKDADGLGDAGLVDQDLRKSSLQSGVNLDVLSDTPPPESSRPYRQLVR